MMLLGSYLDVSKVVLGALLLTLGVQLIWLALASR